MGLFLVEVNKVHYVTDIIKKKRKKDKVSVDCVYCFLLIKL